MSSDINFQLLYRAHLNGSNALKYSPDGGNIRFGVTTQENMLKVMISDDGVTPILMDFGSTVRARIKIETRTQALMQQVYL